MRWPNYEAGFDAAISRLKTLAPTVLHVAWREAVRVIVDTALGGEVLYEKRLEYIDGIPQFGKDDIERYELVQVWPPKEES